MQELMNRLRLVMEEMSDFELGAAHSSLRNLMAPNARIHFTSPFETLRDIDELFEVVYRPLVVAIPDLERRMTIVVNGRTEGGAEMVGVCGYYTGAFRRPWLGIPANGQQVTMRFHEFFRIGEKGIEEVQAVWDLPELMMQTGSWPMAPGLRRAWNVPVASPSCFRGGIRILGTTGRRDAGGIGAASQGACGGHAVGGLLASTNVLVRTCRDWNLSGSRRIPKRASDSFPAGATRQEG